MANTSGGGGGRVDAVRTSVHALEQAGFGAVDERASWADVPDAGFVVRGGALYFGWTFPTYRHKPGRHPDEVM